MRSLFRLTVSLFVLAGCTTWSGAPPSVAKVGSAAPQWTLPKSNGGDLALVSLRGHPLYLNFFATWCPPCNEEAPWVNALQEKYASRGLIVVGVDELEGIPKAEEFRVAHHLVYQTVVDAGILRDQYSVNGLPVHVFIGKDGVIRSIRIGEMSKAEIERALRELL